MTAYKKGGGAMSLSGHSVAVCCCLSYCRICRVMGRGRKVESVPKVPLVASDTAEGIGKTAAAIKALKQIGVNADTEKTKNSIGIHPGKGKMRNRRYGEIVDCNLVRDKGTGKSKGFAFVAYEDQRSTNLAVDNLNGAQVLGRTIRVDHVAKYKKKEEEDEEERQLKREAAGVCRAFQKGECTRGDGCKFSHDEQRAANTGWGTPEDKDPSWKKDKYDGPKKSERQPGTLDSISETLAQERRLRDKDARNSSTKSSEGRKENRDYKPRESNTRDEGYRERDKRSERREERGDKGAAGKSSRRGDADPKLREDCDRREEKRSRRHHQRESYRGGERDKRERY